MIELHDVTKRYGRRTALDEVSLRFDAGEVTLLLGANGAGKSTLLRCLLGITDFEGSIAVSGLDPLADGRAVRALVGYMPQAGGLHPDLTVDETLNLYADIRRVPRDRGPALLTEAGLDGQGATRVGDLSGGMRQRLGFALALLTDPQILVLDEPSASLDAASRDWLARRLRAAAAEGRLVIVSTHAGQELLAAGDRRVMLEEGRVVADDRRAATGASRAETATARAKPRPGTGVPLALKEIKDAVSNRWLLGYAAGLGVLGLAAAASGIDSSSGLALQAFGRTTATLMNLCLLLAPLVAVLMGGLAIAGERERGTLEHLLAQPLSRTALLLAKHAGVLASLTAATLIGFAPAGVLIAWHAGGEMVGHYLLFPMLASVVGAGMAALGLLVSVTSRTAVQSQGAGIIAWFVFVLLYDLVLMGSLGFTGMPVQVLAAALIANPVDAGRVLGILALEPDLYLLGPAGAYLTAQFGQSGTTALLFGSLIIWAVAPLAIAVARFRLGTPRRRPARAVNAVASDSPVARTEEVTFS
jgi:ABC-type multidrug transport system ATPase subunit/ABC-type transport system involved in multi-copper enzyme maturation permease subunit